MADSSSDFRKALTNERINSQQWKADERLKDAAAGKPVMSSSPIMSLSSDWENGGIAPGQKKYAGGGVISRQQVSKPRYQRNAVGMGGMDTSALMEGYEPKGFRSGGQVSVGIPEEEEKWQSAKTTGGGYGGGGGKWQSARTFAEGGPITGPGTGTSDSIPDEMPEGTFIMPADSSKTLGMAKLQEMANTPPAQGVDPAEAHAMGVAMLTKLRDLTHTPVDDEASEPTPDDEDDEGDGGLESMQLEGSNEVVPSTSGQMLDDLKGAKFAGGGKVTGYKRYYEGMPLHDRLENWKADIRGSANASMVPYSDGGKVCGFKPKTQRLADGGEAFSDDSYDQEWLKKHGNARLIPSGSDAKAPAQDGSQQDPLNSEFGRNVVNTINALSGLSSAGAPFGTVKATSIAKQSANPAAWEVVKDAEKLTLPGKTPLTIVERVDGVASDVARIEKGPQGFLKPSKAATESSDSTIIKEAAKNIPGIGASAAAGATAVAGSNMQSESSGDSKQNGAGRKSEPRSATPDYSLKPSGGSIKDTYKKYEENQSPWYLPTPRGNLEERTAERDYVNSLRENIQDTGSSTKKSVKASAPNHSVAPSTPANKATAEEMSGAFDSPNSGGGGAAIGGGAPAVRMVNASDRFGLTNEQVGQANPNGRIAMERQPNGVMSFSGANVKGPVSYMSKDGTPVDGSGQRGDGWGNFDVMPAGNKFISIPGGGYAFSNDKAAPPSATQSPTSQPGTNASFMRPGMTAEQSIQYGEEVANANRINAQQRAMHPARPEGTIMNGMMERTPDQQLRDAQVQASSIHANTAAMGQAAITRLSAESAERSKASHEFNKAAMQEQGVNQRFAIQEGRLAQHESNAQGDTNYKHGFEANKYNNERTDGADERLAKQQLAQITSKIANPDTTERERDKLVKLLGRLNGKDGQKVEVLRGEQRAGAMGPEKDGDRALIVGSDGSYKFVSPNDGASAKSNANPSHVAALKNNPALAAQFDAKYGDGAAERILKGR